VTDYFNILPEPFLTSNIYPYRSSFVQRETKRKTYLADNSFIFLNRVAPDKSRLFENLIFNFLLRKHSEIFYYRTHNNLEVDFFIHKPESKELIQACYSLEDSDTREREIKSLLKAMEELNMDVGTIYSNNHSEEISINNKTINIIPFWKVTLREGEGIAGG